MLTFRNQLILLLLASNGFNISYAEEWTMASPLPVALQEIYTDSHNGNIYVAGGIPAEDAYVSDEFFRYNAQKNLWSKLKPMPEARHHVTISTLDNDIYAVGGFTGQFPNWQAQDSMFIYGLESKKWSKGVSLPAPRGEHVSAVVQGKIYVVGGRVREHEDAKHFEAHIDTKLNQVFDVTSKTWSNAAPALTARNSAAAAVIDGQIYVVGGRQYQQDNEGKTRIVNLPNLEVYDPKQDQWTSRAAMPLSQGGLAAASANGKLYVFGGEQWFPKEQLFANAWVYDPKTNRWKALPDMPEAKHGLAAASIGSDVFVFGGATIPGIGAVKTNQKLSLGSQ